MLTEALHIAHLEAAHLRCSQGAIDGDQLTIRKHISLVEVWLTLCWLGRAPGNPVVEKDSPWLEQMPGLLKVRREQCFAYVLKHAYAHQFRKRLFLTHLPIITHFHATPVCQSVLADALLRPFRLWLAQGNAQRFYAIVLCRIDHQPTPAAPNIQSPLS